MNNQILFNYSKLIVIIFRPIRVTLNISNPPFRLTPGIATFSISDMLRLLRKDRTTLKPLNSRCMCPEKEAGICDSPIGYRIRA